LAVAGAADAGNVLTSCKRALGIAIFLMLSQVASVNAADLPLAPGITAPPWSWAGFYVGGQTGAFGGTSTFSDPYGPSVFGDKVTTNGFLAGLQLGYDWQVAPRWIFGVVADTNYVDSNGSFTCLQAFTTLIGSNCEASPRALATVAGRVGFLVDPLGNTLVYGKGGAAWMESSISIHPGYVPMLAKFPGAMFPGSSTSTNASAWGGTVGAGLEHALTPAWSFSLEYDYYRFATTHVSTPLTVDVTRSAIPTFTEIAAATSGVTQDVHVFKLALNYHWGKDPAAAWAAAPALAIVAMPVKARPIPTLEGWSADVGARYWYSTGTSKNTSGSGNLVSQLTYDNLTGHSGEFFARVDTPSEGFVKGFAGAGGITGGKFNDEDWGVIDVPRGSPVVPTGYEVTESSVSGWLKYAVADVGFNVMHDRNFKIGPFVGYTYFHETMNGFGCTQLVQPGSVCDPPSPANQLIITQDDTWQALRIGVSAQTTIWDRLGINGDLAYLPYAQFTGLDSHWLRQPVAFYPQDGTGRGVQAELILFYRFTENLTFGVGGRYWAMWTTSASQSCHGGCDLPDVATSIPPSPFTANTQRYGMFAQLDYRFYSYR
jgi:opacity protein-like surface antigen